MYMKGHLEGPTALHQANVHTTPDAARTVSRREKKSCLPCDTNRITNKPMRDLRIVSYESRHY